MGGERTSGERAAANALHDQAIPNVLGHAEVHLAPQRDNQGFPDGVLERSEPFSRPTIDQPEELEGIAWRLHALAESFATRSEVVEASLLEGFQKEAARFAAECGDLVIRDADDERISLLDDGSFSGEVVPDDAPGGWRSLKTAMDVVDFFDPGDLFANLADRLAEAFPGIGSSLDDGNAGPRLRQLAEAFAARNAPDPQGLMTEAGLVERFEKAAEPLSQKVGEIIFKDDADERLSLERDGRFLAQVVPEDDESSWRTLRMPDEITEYYSPEELFQALAHALQTAYPEMPSDGRAVAANTLHELALLWREQALDAEATLFDAFSRASAHLGRALGEFVIVDDDDERLIIGRDGELQARVLDRSTGIWQELVSPDELVQSYDPTDVFEDLADALADAFPALAEATEATSEP